MKNLLFILLLWQMTGCRAEAGGTREPTDNTERVDVFLLQPGRLPRERLFSASTMPMEMVVLSFKTSGRLREIHFEEGSRVEKGDLLARLDPVDQYMARRVADAQLKGLLPDVRRLEILSEKGAVPQAERDRILGYRDALATQVSQADIALAATRLSAPFSGIIGKRMAHPGEMIEPARPLGVLLNMDPMLVNAAVPQTDLELFEIGREVEVLFTDGHTRTGKVHRVATVADPVTRLFQVSVRVKNPPDGPSMLRVGQLARIRIGKPDLEGLFVPAELLETGTKDLARMVVVRDNRLGAIAVTIEERLGPWARITGDIPENTQVVVRGLELPAGRPVEIGRTFTMKTWSQPDVVQGGGEDAHH